MKSGSMVVGMRRIDESTLPVVGDPFSGRPASVTMGGQKKVRHYKWKPNA